MEGLWILMDKIVWPYKVCGKTPTLYTKLYTVIQRLFTSTYTKGIVKNG